MSLILTRKIRSMIFFFQNNNEDIIRVGPLILTIEIDHKLGQQVKLIDIINILNTPVSCCIQFGCKLRAIINALEVKKKWGI